MSFEDLQKKWAGQFQPASEGADQRAAAELLERIHGAERRLRYLMVFTIAQHVCAILFVAALGLLFAVYGFPLPKPILLKYLPLIRGVALGFILLSISLIRLGGRFWRQSTPSSDEPRGLLYGRVDRDYRRFSTLVLWRDLKEVACGIYLVSIFSLRAVHVVHYPALAWVTVVFFALPTTAVLIYRLQTWVRSPIVDGTMLGTLQQSIYYTRRQVRLLDNIWWYIGPMVVGFLISMTRIWIVKGNIPRQAIWPVVVFLGVSWAAWKLNRWVARSRLRPRLERLEKLQSELSA